MTHPYVDKSYPDLRLRFHRALSSLLPAAAIFPLRVVLEGFEEYAACGPARSERERNALGRMLDALLHYRETYQESRRLPDAHPEGVSCDLPFYAAVARLVRELPPEATAWRTGNGPVSAAELAQAIEDRTDLGLQYGADLVRVARDLIGRKSRRGDECAADPG